MLSVYLTLVTDEDDKNIIIYIYEKYYSYMANSVANELGDRRYVEDIVHNVMLTLIEIIENIDYSDKKKLLHLCILIAKRKAIDFKRKKSNSDISIEACKDSFNIETESPEDIVINHEAYEKIKAAFDELEYIYKEVCQLRFLHSIKEKDIAKMLGVSESVVSMRIFRARQKLAEILRRESINV
ncbi:MAG: sigma-70 family RNA polymerase sigma factor [Ruminococcaceae bacterium]|nr:sigma-70 family RNA polymerase sigma factor [Oscillospiraceae bacterium]